MIYLDANVIIRLIEGDASSRAPIEHRLVGEAEFVTSQLSRLECRCLPIRNSDKALLDLYDQFFSVRELRLVDIDPRIIDAATHLRANEGFKTPDAIHLASAIASGVSSFLTGDIKLARCTRTRVEII